MARKATHVKLSDEDLEKLQEFVKTGTHSSRQIQRAQILLLNHQGQDRKSIKAIFNLSLPTIGTVITRYLEQGLLQALTDRARSGATRKITSEFEAHVTSIACSDAPEGRINWTLRMLKDKAIELKYIDSISDESIRTILKKVNLNRGCQTTGVLGQ
jgi:putative transposase